MSHTALITDLASVLDSVAGGREGAELFRVARLVLDGYQRRVMLEDLELEVLGVAWAARSAVTIAISSWRVAQGLEDQEWAERYNARRVRMIETIQAAGWQLGGAGRPRRRRVAGRAAGRGVRADRRPAVLRRADRGRLRERRVDHRHRRPHVPRRLQQRAVRRSRAPARHRRDRAAEPAHQHAHALPASGGDRARRAARGDVPAGARHRDARQLGVRGERPRLADRDRRHRAARRALHRVRLPRHHGGDRRAVTRGLARRRAPRARRDVGAARRRGAVSRGAGATAAPRRRPRSSTGSSRATGSPISTPATCRSSCA